MKKLILILTFILIGAYSICQAKTWQEYDIYTTPADDDYFMLQDTSDPADPDGILKRLAWLYVQPRDDDLTSIAALSTASYGRTLLTLANEAALQALITTPWTVPDGGLGGGFFTDGGVLLGSGAGAVTPMAELADGEMIVGDGDGDPVPESGPTLRTSIGVGTGDAPTFAALNTGNGNNELFAMNQDVESTDAVTFLSVTGDLYQDCNISEPGDYEFGQEVCAAGASWNPSGQDWTGFVDAEKKHLVQMIEPDGSDCTATNDPHTCCSSATSQGTDLAASDHTGPAYTVTSAAGGFSSGMVGENFYVEDTGAGGHFVIGTYVVSSYTSATEIALTSDPTDGTNETAGDYDSCFETWIAIRDWVGNGYVDTMQARMNQITDPDDLVMTSSQMNSVIASTGAGTITIPTNLCDDSTGFGLWITVKALAAHTYSIASADASDQFILTDGSELTAGNVIDSDGAKGGQITVMCMSANKWWVVGELGTVAADGGAS